MQNSPTASALTPVLAASTHTTALATEQPNGQHAQLDCYATADLVAAFVDDQAQAALAVRAAAPALAAAVEAATPRLAAGGRLIYVGAGTSGRLGVLDSVELLPTFSWPRERALACLAGGQGAMFMAVEGAEDSAEQGAADALAHSPGPQDVVICIAASGTTPYAIGAAQAARQRGALTVAMTNNAGAPLAAACEIAVVLGTGAEVISGSTRLKAGTAQKIALNTLSSSLMVRQNKVYGNLMVDLRASNAKLRARAVALTQRATGATAEQAAQALAACEQRVKVAVVMLKAQVDATRAVALLKAGAGSVHAALARA